MATVKDILAEEFQLNSPYCAEKAAMRLVGAITALKLIHGANLECLNFIISNTFPELQLVEKETPTVKL